MGNSYITGSVSVLGENSNIATIKYNSAGARLWVDLYNGPPGSNSIDYPIAIRLDKFKNIYVCGYSESAGLGSNDYLIIKYNNNGVRQWVTRYNSSGSWSDEPYDCVLDNSENIYVTGRSYNGVRFDALTIKYNSNGDTLWTRRYSPASFNSIGSSIVVDNLGNSYISVQNNFSLYLVKYNSSGVQQWAIPGASCYNIKSVIDSGNNIYIGGETNIGMPISSDFYACKYNSSGVLQWSKTYNGPINGNEGFKSLTISNNFLYIVGYSPSAGAQSDYLTIKYNAITGDTVWLRRYNGTASDIDEPNSIVTDNTDNVYVTGFSSSVSGGDITTIKYNGLGSLIWELRYPGVGTDVKLNPNDYSQIFVLGKNFDTNSNGDLITLKYSQPVGIINYSQIPLQFKLNQNYPNPFNPKTIISYELPTKCHIKVNVITAAGEQVSTLVNENKSAGKYTVSFDASRFSTGVYFYSLLINGALIDSKKMVIVK